MLDDEYSLGITGGTGPNASITSNPNADITALTGPETILNDSRMSPAGNGNASAKLYTTQPTSGQKWWAAVLLGFIFAIISSPAAYMITSKATTSLGGAALTEGSGPTFAGLLIHTIIFIIIVRIILW